MIIGYRTNLADALEESGKVPAVTHVSNMQRSEEYRTLSRRIKYTGDKFSKPGTTLVTEKQTDSRTLEITEKYHYRRL